MVTTRCAAAKQLATGLRRNLCVTFNGIRGRFRFMKNAICACVLTLWCGAITFATAGPNPRTTQLFINFGDNANLDKMGFSPFGKVVEGMDVVDKIHSEYGEGAPSGRGPRQDRVQREGNAYLKKDFPNLD